MHHLEYQRTNKLMKIEQTKISDASAITQFQVDMAAESEGTTLNREVVFRGLTEGLKDEDKKLSRNKGSYFL